MKSILVCCFCTLAVFATQAQSEPENYHRIINTVSTGFSGTGANIDVKYHKLSWRINPDTAVKYIKGFVQTNFVTTQNAVTSISFDLNAVLQVDSVIFRNNKLAAGNISRSGNILTIALGTVIANNVYDSIIVFYQGIPPAPSGASTGYVRVNSAGAGNYITTLSESYEDRDWWPCKADMQDKIDSIDIEVSVPWGTPTAADTFWVASNGKLLDSTINGTERKFIYSTRYPIASYLVFVSVARFNRYYSGTVNIGGTQVPSVYYLLKGKADAIYDAINTAMDKMKPVLQAFSNKFSDYPFKLEKHGYYDGLSGAAGMEHQTFSGIAAGSLTSLRTLAHELMHQWFGDNVTFSTWNDLWLAEGFARYSECLVGELVPSLGLNPFTIRNNFKNSALALSNVSLWIPNANISSSNTIWNSNYGSAVYERGAMIVSMLRTMCGDTKYFEALSAYQTNIGGATATTDSLKHYINIAAGQDVSAFFNDYVGGSGNGAIPVGGIGNPIYLINWSVPQANRLTVSVGSQTKTAGSNVTYFRSPVVLHVKGTLPAEDTTITFFDWGSGNLSYAGNGIGAPISGNALTYELSFTPVTVLFDDSSRTLSTGSTNKLLPVPFYNIRFQASRQANGNNVDLLLEADRLQNVLLEKSADGISFENAGEMQRVGSIGNSLHYQFQDVIPFMPVTYYRARLLETGRETYTGIAKVISPIRSRLLIQPNPAHGRVNIQFNNTPGNVTTVRILNAAGSIVQEYHTGETNIYADLKNMASGMYLVQQLIGGKIIVTEKMVVY